MTKTLNGEFLPLGSIVRLEGTDHDNWLYFIVARAITRGEEEDIIPRYRVAPHPFGDTPSQEVFSIRDSQIVEVIFKGYQDREDEKFLDGLFELMEGSLKDEGGGKVVANPTPTLSPVQKVNEGELLKKDPFYKFRKGKGEL